MYVYLILIQDNSQMHVKPWLFALSYMKQAFSCHMLFFPNLFFLEVT